jgi:rRNA maturation endonuclease Nob1
MENWKIRVIIGDSMMEYVYVCHNCWNKFRKNKRAIFCPVCTSGNIREYVKSYLNE